MRVLGVAFGPRVARDSASESTVALLDAAGRITRTETAGSLVELASAISGLVGDEPFLAGVNLPIVVPQREGRSRPVEAFVRRRLGYRLPPGGRSAGGGESSSVPGEALLAALATAGHPCLPYPDRDRRESGLAEVHPGLTLKSLLWQGTGFDAERGDPVLTAALFRAYEPPRSAATRRAAGWTEAATGLDIVLRLVGAPPEFDLAPARRALNHAESRQEVDRARGLLDAGLAAGTARLYIESPESCLFAGDRESGYVILPADPLIRRLALSISRTGKGRLFPETSLREQLGEHARLRAADLLAVPGRPQRIEAAFHEPPNYEFDNLDEMLWWKHTRHVAGALVPTDGLQEMIVRLGGTADESTEPSLRLVRSRHRTLSFRFEPPEIWRTRVPTRDGRTHHFRILRAVYETATGETG